MRLAIRNGAIDLLPHWLQHYRDIGFDGAAITMRDDGFVREVKAMADAARFHVELNLWPRLWHDVEIEEEIMPEHLHRLWWCGQNVWIGHADLDELNEYPRPINELAERIENGGNHAFTGHFIDRIAEDGSMPAAQPTPSIGLQYPLACHITTRVLGGFGQKVMLSRGDVKVGSGHHSPYCSSTHWMRGLGHVHHFKWREGVIERLRWGLANTGSPDSQWGREATTFIDFAKDGKIPVNDRRIGAEFWGDKRPQIIPRTHNFVCPSA